MKIKFKILILAITALFVACEEENTLEITSPDGIALTDPGIGILVIKNENLDNQAFNITWTDNSNAGSTYAIDLATDDLFENMTNIGSTDGNSFSFSQEELNTTLLSLNAAPVTENLIFLRVNAGSESSNAVSFIAVPILSDTPMLQTPSTGDSFTLLSAESANEAFLASWMYTGDVDFDISYEVQTALAGSNFDTFEVIGEASNENSVSVSVLTLNDAAFALGVGVEETADLDIRVKSSYAYSNGQVIEDFSQVSTISVTTYNPVFPYLYLVGDATTPGWSNNNNNTAVFRSQDTPNSYYFTGYFNAGAFKMLEVLGEWHPQWGDRDGNLGVSNLDGSNEAGVFSVPTAGYYTFTASSMVEGGSYTFEAYDASADPTYNRIGLIGAAIGGWGDGDEIDLTQDPNNPHLWFANGVTFNQGEEFLIRPNDDWNNGVWRYTGSQELFGQANIADGGDNFPFTEATGSYDFWFNDIDGSYVIIPNED